MDARVVKEIPIEVDRVHPADIIETFVLLVAMVQSGPKDIVV